MDTEKKTTNAAPKAAPAVIVRPEDANQHTRAYMDHILVEMRAIDSVMPSLETKILGRSYATPLMTPAFSHLNKPGKEGPKPMVEYARAAKELGMLNFVGMVSNDEFAEIAATGAPTVRIIKPFADHDMILDQIRFAEAHGAVAVGIDIDHVPGKDGQYDHPDDMPLAPVMLDDLKRYVASTSLPFITKGVLSSQDALKSREAGCRAVLVSHHHGRVPFGMPPVAMIPAVKEALKGSGMEVFCDCHIDSGYDAYKALAMGANAVAPGRILLKPLMQEGKDGVVKKIKEMHNQLKEMMLYTGIGDTHSFDASVLHVGQL